MPAFYEREEEFVFIQVEPVDLEGNPMGVKAIMCGKSTDEAYRQDRCKTEEEYHLKWGRWGIDKIWRDDILPCRLYLRHCVNAAKSLYVIS